MCYILAEISPFQSGLPKSRLLLPVLTLKASKLCRKKTSYYTTRTILNLDVYNGKVCINLLNHGSKGIYRKTLFRILLKIFMHLPSMCTKISRENNIMYVYRRPYLTLQILCYWHLFIIINNLSTKSTLLSGNPKDQIPFHLHYTTLAILSGFAWSWGWDPT